MNEEFGHGVITNSYTPSSDSGHDVSWIYVFRIKHLEQRKELLLNQMLRRKIVILSRKESLKYLTDKTT